MTMRTSDAGVAFIKRWEEFVGYVYDDKIPKRRSGGVLQYPEWGGGPVRGTLTIGYGHTNAAGAPLINRGMRVTEAEASAILAHDLVPCEHQVADGVHVPLAQHQFDALASFTFNCGPGNLRRLVVGLNAGDYGSIPQRLMLYVTSKGERMQGLVNRRSGEVKLWNTPDDPAVAEVHDTFSPKAEEDAPPKSMAQSKTGWAAVAATVTGVGSTLGQAMDSLRPLLTDPRTVAVVVAIIAIAGAFIWFDRRAKLRNSHV